MRTTHTTCGDYQILLQIKFSGVGVAGGTWYERETRDRATLPASEDRRRLPDNYATRAAKQQAGASPVTVTAEAEGG